MRNFTIIMRDFAVSACDFIIMIIAVILALVIVITTYGCATAGETAKNNDEAGFEYTLDRASIMQLEAQNEVLSIRLKMCQLEQAHNRAQEALEEAKHGLAAAKVIKKSVEKGNEEDDKYGGEEE